MFPRLDSPVALEEQVRQFWETHRVFTRSVEQQQGRPTWVFYEGPPTANGTPHNGHVLTRVMKDVFPRFRSMQGYAVPRKAGWDTHGLPVEVEVEKQLGLKGRQQIADFGLEAFNRACRDNVFTYIQEWNDLTRDIGFWVDLDDPYVTYHKAYVESVWWALSRLFDKGLLYQGHKVVWWWPQGGTTLSAAEVGLGYKTVDDPAATVRFRDADNPRRAYLAWTTTPWTLPSNVALAVGARITYAVCEDPDDPAAEVVLAEARAEAYGLTVKSTLSGAEIVGKRYTPVFDFGPVAEGDSFVVVAGDHVTTSSGTGIVHTAPAYGEDDMRVAQAHGIGMLVYVDADGLFVEGTPWAGTFCKDADSDILRDLRESGLLLRWDTYQHDYPFCWRASDDPLIQFARPAWFIRTTARKDEALAGNNAVGWHPEHIRDGRMGDFLRNNVDWALSRERFWGTPLNIWTCEACEHRVAPSSVDDLVARGAKGLRTDVEPDLMVHRPWIDDVTLPCPECGGEMVRVPEVIDCWFDSGSMHFAQHGWPHQGDASFKSQFPADFISEAIDQTRGWFYTSLMVSTLLFDDETCREYGLEPVGHPRPYKNCVVLGHVCDKDGFKESKSKGNYTSPFLVMRGVTWQIAVPDASLQPGTFGLKPRQVDSLGVGDDPVVLSVSRDKAEGPSLSGPVVPTEVAIKDAVAVHPQDLAALGLPAEGGKVWFHVPFDPPGADAFRWLFCYASPPWSNTRLSLKAIREGQREFLIRLRNVYQFYGIYANIAADKGQYAPGADAPRSVAQRSVLDRWITHRLHATIGEVTEHMEGFRLYEASRALLAFVDDLSNWYVRRSRARFWGEGAELEDALYTLDEVLRATARLMAPFTPYHAEALFRALEVSTGRADEDASVHLGSWPEVDASLLDEALDADMALARKVASLGLAARTDAGMKVRQPAQAITVVLADPSRQAAIERFDDLIRDELNVREVRFGSDAADFVEVTVKPDFKALGPKLGKGVKEVAGLCARTPGPEIQAAVEAGGWAVTLSDGREVVLTADDLDVRVSSVADSAAASAPEAVVVLDTKLTDDLRAEGFVRELTSKVQGLRKQADLGFTDRITLVLVAQGDAADAIGRFGDGLAREVLASTWSLSPSVPDGEGWSVSRFDVDGAEVVAAYQVA